MKKKILFINGHMNTGGVEKSLLDVLVHLDYSLFDVDLLLTEEIGDYGSQIPSQVNVRLCSIVNTYGSVFGSLARCIKSRDWVNFRLRLVFLAMKLVGQKAIRPAAGIMLGKHHYDTVIGYRTGICTQLAAFSVNADHRYVWWHHGLFNVDAAEYSDQIQCCDKVVAVSEPCRRMILEKCSVDKEKVFVIPNMIDEAGIRQRAREYNPYDNNCTNIVSVGRLAEEKHFENVIPTAVCLRHARIRFKWYIVGEGAERGKLERLIAENNVGDCVILTGNQVNPYPYIAHADLFVHPSYAESQGIVVMEALTLGVPVVATRNDGVCEFLQDSINARLSEQSAGDLASKVHDIIKSQDAIQKLKANAACPDANRSTAVIARIVELLCA